MTAERRPTSDERCVESLPGGPGSSGGADTTDCAPMRSTGCVQTAPPPGETAPPPEGTPPPHPIAFVPSTVSALDDEALAAAPSESGVAVVRGLRAAAAAARGIDVACLCGRKSEETAAVQRGIERETARRSIEWLLRSSPVLPARRRVPSGCTSGSLGSACLQ